MELLEIKNWSERNKILVCLLSSLIIQIFGSYFGVIFDSFFLFDFGIVSFYIIGAVYLLWSIKDFENRFKPMGEYIYSNNLIIAAILIALFIPIIPLPFFIEVSQLERETLMWNEAGGILISILTLLTISIFKKLEDIPFFNLIFPSKEANFQRIYVISFLLMSISPIFIVVNEELGRTNLYYDHFNTFVFYLMEGLFILWLFFMIYSATSQLRKRKSQERSYETKVDDRIRSNYFILFASIILTFNIGLALEFSPDFLIKEIPSLFESSSEFSEGIWGFIFSAFLLYVCIYMMFVGPQSLKILNKLSTVKEKTLGVKGILLSLFVGTAIFVILKEPSRVEPFYWLILLIIILESCALLLIFWMFQNAPMSLRFLRLPQIIVVIFVVLSMYIITYFANTSHILLIIIPFCFILLNHVAANYLFLQFDFHSFLSQEITNKLKLVDEKEVAQIFLIELLDFTPLDKKIEVAQRIVNFFEKNNETPTVQQTRHEIENITLTTLSEEYMEKVGIHQLYFEIATAYYQQQLPLKENVPLQFLVQLSALKVDDYFSLGTLLSSFFEGFMRIVKIKLENDTDLQEESSLRKDGVRVATILNLPINEFHKIADIRNKFVHSNRIDFSVYDQKDGILKILRYSRNVFENYSC